jgi:homoserine dehydrogenase
MNKEINIGLFGFGVVGSGLYNVLNLSNANHIKISKIVVKNPKKKRSIPAENFSLDKDTILLDLKINTVVELINDPDEAYEIVKTALQHGKNVVSANKKMIAEHLNELIELASDNNVSFMYEAAVAGSIPIIRNLEEYYNNDTLSSIHGIVNGTTNFILTQANQGISYKKALQIAQEKGFAETDPTSDVDGFDSKYKLSILIKHAFGIHVDSNSIFNNGIRNIKPRDIQYANEKGYRIKLFARAEKIDNQIIGFVAPHFVTQDNFSYQVNNEFNAITVEAAFSDKQLFIGKGAGSFPTASAVLSDISALVYDYKYEYRKSVIEGKLNFTSNFYVRVYLGSENRTDLSKIDLIQEDESFFSDEYSFKIGWIVFSELAKFDFNQWNEISLIILPNELELAEIDHYILQNTTELILE